MMLTRRESFSSIVFTGMLLSSSSIAYANPIAITAVAVAFEKVAEAFGTITKNVLEALRNSLKIWSTVEAVQARGELTDLSKTLSRFFAIPSLAVESKLDDYIQRWETLTKDSKVALSTAVQTELASEWVKLRSRVSDTLGQALSILDKLNSYKSPFVATDVYTDLNSALAGRSEVLASISKMDTPQTKAEIDELRRVVEAYQSLLKNLREAISSLNDYVSMISEGQK